MEPSEIVIDPEFQKLIPALTPEERKGLEASLIADGCISPLVVWFKHNILLDGHNRHAICLKHDIECEVHEIVLESRDDAKAWIIKNQLGRRNLDESQRAMLAARLKDVFAHAAKDRQKQHGGTAPGRPKDETLVSDLTQVNAGRAREQAAAAMNVSSGLVHAAEKVISDGTESLQQAVMGGQVSVSAAAEVAALPKKKQDDIVADGSKAIAEAAREIRRQRRAASPQTAAKKKLTSKQIIQLVELVTELDRLTDKPGLEISPIHVRACVAEIMKIVL